MKKQSKKQRIKALEYEVLTLRVLFECVLNSESRQPVKSLELESFSSFTEQLRKTEAEYEQKAS